MVNLAKFVYRYYFEKRLLDNTYIYIIEKATIWLAEAPKLATLFFKE